MSAEELISRLDGVKQTAPGRWLARCPAHEDRRASLSIRELDDGRVLIHDFAGCHVDQIVGAVGLSVSDLFPARETVRYERHPRSGIHSMDALAVLVMEARIVKIAATDIHNGVEISDDDMRRLGKAVSLICAVEGVCHA